MRAFSIAIAILLFAGSATAATLERVRDSGVIKLGYRDDAAPYSYNTAEGEPAGYIVDVCRAVAATVKARLALADLKVDYVEVTAEDRFEAVSSGKIDLLCDPTSMTLSRWEKVDFSLMTFVDGASVIYRADGPAGFEGLAGQKVGVRAGTTTQEALTAALQQMGINAEVVPVESHEDGLKGVTEGDLAAYFADRAILIFLLMNSSDAEDLRLSDQYYTHESYALALPHGDDQFRQVVNETLARLYRSRDILPIFFKNFGQNAKPSEALTTMFIMNALPD